MLTIDTRRGFTNTAQQIQNKKQTTFTATPSQIIDKLEFAQICAGKRRYLTNLADYFNEYETKLNQKNRLQNSFDYFLTKENNIPKEIEKTKIRTGFLSWKSFKKFDKELNEQTFSCGSDSHCNCGKGKSLAEYTAELLQRIGVDKPDRITLKKQ